MDGISGGNATRPARAFGDVYAATRLRRRVGLVRSAAAIVLTRCE